MRLTLEELQKRLPSSGMFAGKTWKWSPQPLPLDQTQVESILALAHPLAKFQQACDQIYRASVAGKAPGWIAETLERGKPDWLIDWQRSSGSERFLPRIIRPDLLLTDDNFIITELDSVPGGMGMTAWLAQIYADAGFSVFGGADGMIEGFRGIMPKGGDVMISRESSDYLPEMEWLTAQLGDAWNVVSAEQAKYAMGNYYRFFELYDWQSIPQVREFAAACARGECDVTPSFKQHLEEKLWLVTPYLPSLRETWNKHLRGNYLKRIMRHLPYGWVVDATEAPPFFALPKLDAHSWHDVANFSQKDRRLVLKRSGYHQDAWGSKSVFIGHDLSQSDWHNAVNTALAADSGSAWIMQEFVHSKAFTHPVFDADGKVVEAQVRARLCPYFFRNAANTFSLGGCLATLTPADKKLIHGMSDAVLTVCALPNM